MTGVWPTQVDHKNRDRSDNRWDNLREATVSQNSGNSVRPSAQGLPKGVRPNKGGFQAKIWGTGKWKCLGTYPTPELASEAYKQAAIEKYGDFARW